VQLEQFGGSMVAELNSASFGKVSGVSPTLAYGWRVASPATGCA
jgi:hypothetical protein